jgi:hypothetical protein
MPFALKHDVLNHLFQFLNKKNSSKKPLKKKLAKQQISGHYDYIKIKQNSKVGSLCLIKRYEKYF